MERPRPRLLKSPAASPVSPALALLLVLLLVPAAAGERLAEDPDETGDTTSGPGVTVTDPTVDLVTFTADRDGDTLLLRNEVAAPLPLPGTAEPNATRLYTFVFVLDVAATDERPLVQVRDSVILCTFHHGTADLSCKQTQGERTLLGIAVEDRNATVRVALEPGEDVTPLRGGGAVTLTDQTNETDPVILGQDWTPTTIGGQDVGTPEPGGDAESEDAAGTPWYKTRVGALAALAAVVLVSVFAYQRWKQRPE